MPKMRLIVLPKRVPFPALEDAGTEDALKELSICLQWDRGVSQQGQQKQMLPGISGVAGACTKTQAYCVQTALATGRRHRICISGQGCKVSFAVRYPYSHLQTRKSA